MIWANQLSLDHRYLAWQSLARSKFTYGRYCMLRHHPKLEKLINTTNYHTMLGLFNIKSKIKMTNFFKLVTGLNMEDYNSL